MRRLSLWILVLASLAGYIGIGLSFPLLPNFNRPPLPDIFSFTPSLAAGLAYVALIGALFFLYWLAYRRVRHRPIHLAVILSVAAIFCIPLIAAFPYNSTDVYRYFIRARVLVLHGQSPFVAPPSAFPSDPFLPLAGEWATATSPYGPLWELVAAGITLISPQNLQVALILFKTLASALLLAIGGLIWATLGGDIPPAERCGRALLWAWNPALLLISAVNAHNDVLMLFWLVLSWWLFRRRPVAGLLVLALAPLTKPIALLALPFFYIAALRRAPDHRSRLQWLIAAGVGSLVLALLAFLPFAILSGQPAGSLVDLVRRLLTEAGEGGGFSFTALLILLVRYDGGYLPVRWVTGVAGLLFGIFFLWILWRAVRGRSPLRSIADGIAGYLIEAFRFRIWYAAWPFPWLLLDSTNGRSRLTAGIWFLLTTQLSVFIYSHLWRLVFYPEHVWTHVIGVPFTFLLPLVVALIQRRIARHDRTVSGWPSRR
jgi:hypothetical protein